MQDIITEIANWHAQAPPNYHRGELFNACALVLNAQKVPIETLEKTTKRLIVQLPTLLRVEFGYARPTSTAHNLQYAAELRFSGQAPTIYSINSYTGSLITERTGVLSEPGTLLQHRLLTELASGVAMYYQLFLASESRKAQELSEDTISD